MTLIFLLKGIILGIAIAAPVGPVGLLCIGRTIHYGRFSGFFSGLGAAVADTFFGVIAGFGLTYISDFLEAQKIWIHIIGGTFLLALGFKTFFFAKKLKIRQDPILHTTYFSDFISTFFLTLSNPLTLFGFLAIFAGIGLPEKKHELLDATFLVLGIFLGSCVWWLALSEGVTYFREKISQKVLLWINRFAGILIMIVGLFVYVSWLFDL